MKTEYVNPDDLDVLTIREKAKKPAASAAKGFRDWKKTKSG